MRVCLRICLLILLTELAGVSLAAAKPNYYVLDSGFWSSSTVVEVCSYIGRTGYGSRVSCEVFDSGGGRLNASGDRVVGQGMGGEEISVVLADIETIKVRIGAKPDFEAIEIHLDALQRDTSWRPRGPIRRVVLVSGEILEFAGMTPLLDTDRALIAWEDKDRTQIEIPFREVLCVQVDRLQGYKHGSTRNRDGSVSRVELLSGEMIDLVDHISVLDPARKVVSYRSPGGSIKELMFSDVRLIHVEKLAEDHEIAVLSDIQLGSRVRATVVDQSPDRTRTRRVTGILTEITASTIVLRESANDAPMAVPREDITQLEKSVRPMSRVKGAAVGLVVGAGFGTLMAIGAGSDSGSGGAELVALGVTATFALAGLIIGAPEQWQTLDVSGVTVGFDNPTGQGSGIVVGLRF